MTLMIDRTMRVIVFFDLPVSAKRDRKAYAAFRKYLINDGYDMLQFSVYSRIAQNHDDAGKHVARLMRNLPPKGSVRVMQVTEKQYNSMLILVGNRTATEDFLTPDDFIEL